ncbi:MAG: hypothetical protein KC620_08940, partial [Myxococcales bacterium]|nr:hypothetical protein [Myxococcales bacterium]
MTDRVAITGIGLIGPAGIGLAACLARLAEGPLVAAQPPADEAPAVPAPALLDVPAGFKPQQYLERRKDLKLMARANRLAVAAACLACEDAGLDFAALCDAALMLGVGREPGSLDDILPALSRSHDEHGRVDLGRLVAEGMGCMNPLSSLKTLPNMSLAHVAIRLGAMGPSQTRCAGPDAGLAAVLEAVHALREGRAPLAIAGATDHRTSFTDRLTAARLAEAGEGDAEAPVAEGAALLVLEPLAAARARGARVYAVLDVAEKPGPEPAGAFGDCGAATALIDAVLAMARGEPGHAGSLVFAPPAIAADRRAPAVHIRRGDDPVAITGVGLATPLGQRMADFTPALLAGKCGTGPIQAFDAPGFPVKNACEIRDFSAEARLPAELHAAVAGLDDRKAELALAAAIDAVRSHGAFDPAAGVAYGTGLSSVSVRELEQDYLPFLTADGALDFAAFGRGPHPKRPQSPWRHLVDRPVDLLRRHLRLRGPGSCHFSACAAAAEAIGHAADRIRRGEVPMMLAGGADSMVHPFGMLPFILLGATSPEADPARAGRPFDQDRDG